jgi:crotonobetainyl-CoA:carnitine CoA-transferase CaiB-like acyl-CoA transferase
MDYCSLVKANLKIIYASATGFGTRGPDKDAGAFDYQGQGMSGMMYAFGEPEMPPLLGQFGIIDQATAVMASYQIVIALLMRERLGVGQEVDVSILGTASYLLYFNNLVALLKGRNMPRHEQVSADPLRNYYCCQDGNWVIQTQPPGEERWGKTCRVLGRPELAEDQRFNSRDKRMEHSRELVSIFNKAFATRPRDEWLRLFREADLIICPINTALEAIDSPQLIENDYVVDFDHPEIGEIRIPGFPIHFSRAEVNKDLVAPKLGEHTEEVLREIGGYSDKEIARFREGKII